MGERERPNEREREGESESERDRGVRGRCCLALLVASPEAATLMEAQGRNWNERRLKKGRK